MVKIGSAPFRFALILTALLTLALAGCQESGPAPTVAPGPDLAGTSVPGVATRAPAGTPINRDNSLVIGLRDEPDTLNYYYSNKAAADWVIRLINRGLFSFNDHNDLVPELADKIPSLGDGSIAPDGKTITVTLRSGVKWHDGQPVTAADVAFTWAVVTNPANVVATRYGYDQIEAVDTPDDTTAVLRFKRPFAPWPTLFPVLLPRHLLATLTTLDKADYNRAPVGFGPFKFASWQPGVITLDRNPDYWRGAPQLDHVYVRFLSDRAAVLAEVAAERVDVGVDFTETSLGDIAGLEPKAHLIAVPDALIEHYLFNLDEDRGPAFFQEEAVRKAINLAIDRQTILQRFLSGRGQMARTFWDNSFYENTLIKPYPFEPDTARRLLSEAGWKVSKDGIREKNGVRLSFTHQTISGSLLRENVQRLIQQNLSDVGIEMTIENSPADRLFSGYAEGGPLASGSYEMAGYSDGATTGDPDVSHYFRCSQVPTDEAPDGANWYRLCDAELDRLLDEQAQTVDREARKKIYDQIEQIMYDRAYMVLLYHRLDLYAVNARVKNFRPPTILQAWWWNAQEWGVK